MMSFVVGCTTPIRDECQFHFDYKDRGLMSLNKENIRELVNHKDYCNER